MKSFIYLFLCLFISLVVGTKQPVAKIDKLSAEDAIHALSLLDQFNSAADNTTLANLTKQFHDLTGADPDSGLRTKLYEIIDQNVHHTSFFTKLAGLVSFQNLLLVCMVAVGVVFVISLFKDVIILL
jgi:hypothetical protein